MPLFTLHPPRLFLLPVLRPNSHLNCASISCCRRLASVSGRSLGWIRLLAAAAVLASFPLLAELLFFSFLSPPWLDRQVRVLERKLDWKEEDCGEGLLVVVTGEGIVMGVGTGLSVGWVGVETPVE